jgi:4-amino-4-deoxy-L-arabinose transferase-like glycosyltransferase
MGLVKHLRSFFADRWQLLVAYGVLLLALGGLLFVRLGSLLPGFSSHEVQSYQASASLRYIFDHPLDAPFTLVTNGLTYVSNHTYLLTRLAAVLFGLITLIAFFWLVRFWYGQRTALIGTVLFGASAWFLHTSRAGSSDVLLFLPLVLVACSVWLKKTDNPWVLLLCFGLGASLLYVPGMVWLVLLGVLWQWRTIDRVFKRHLWIVSLGGLFLMAALVPLGYAMYRMPELWKTLVGLPAEGWPQIMDVLQNLYQIPHGFLYSLHRRQP